MLTSTNFLTCQDSSRYRIGLHTGAYFSQNTSDIPIIWGTTDCGKFSDGTSFGYNAGLNLSYLFLPDFLWLDLRFLYKSLPIQFTTTTNQYQVYDPRFESYVPLNILHTFDAKLGFLTLEPGVILTPIKDLPIKLRFAFEASHPVFQSDYTNSEQIESPKIYNFLDGTQKHIVQSGTLPGSGTSLALIGGLIFEHQLSSNLYANLDIYYRYPLNSVLADYNFKSTHYGINFGLEYAFDLSSKQEPPKIIPKIDTPKAMEPILVNKVEPTPVTKVEPDIKIGSTPLVAMETIVTHTYPLLPYVFFDSASSELKSKYRQLKRSMFSEKNLPNNALKIYNSMLEIISNRLAANPKAELIITGSSDGSEVSGKSAQLELAKQRAESVSRFFTENYHLDSLRFKIKVRETPELATSTSYKEGFEENRRVEISTKDFDILKPVVYSRFKEYELKSDEIDINLSIEGTEEISKIKFEFNAGDTVVFSKILDEPKDLKIKLSPDQKDRLAKSLNSSEIITLKCTYEYDGKIKERYFSPQISKIENKFELGRLNLIVFDFDKSEITPFNKELINTFVTNTISDSSTVSIIGSTDKLGEKDYNLTLSAARAESAYKLIKKVKPLAEFKEIKGIGDSKLQYDNSIPEGRFYSRTVLIEVVTPVK